MGKIKSLIPVFISVVLAVSIIFLMGMQRTDDNKNPREIYKVYIDGELVGAIKSKKALEEYIDKEQEQLKNEYDVDNVYIPNGIDIQKDISYDGELLDEREIYKLIKSKKSFTIKGYIITISKEGEKDVNLYTLDKDLFDKAVQNVLNAFVSEEEVSNYKNDTQPEIKTTGSTIENIYLGQDVTIKQAFISTDELIFTNETDLTKYLLFGTLDAGEEYEVKLGDTIETVAFNNKLSTKEFLIVNPEFTNANNILSVGQKVSVALIEPKLQVVVEKNVVEDVDKPYETIEKEDPNLDKGTEQVEVEGVNGSQRVYEKIQYVNGQTQNAYVTNAVTLKEPVNKVVLKGTKETYSGGSYYSGGGTPAVTSGNWGWPTISPYIITSYFEWRWGRLHEGIDISGCGFGSPIYAIADGTVLSTVSYCANYGSYNDSCGDYYGNHVWIAHPEGVYVVYAHLVNSVLVSPGQTVSKGQIIGYMGDSGSSTGTHLHLGTFYGGTKYGNPGGGTPFDPYALY